MIEANFQHPYIFKFYEFNLAILDILQFTLNPEI